MAELEEILVRIEGDVRGLKRALDQGERKVGSSTRKMEGSFGRLNKAMNGIAVTAARLAPILAVTAGTAAAVGIVRAADQYSLLSGRLTNVTGSAENAEKAMSELLRISNDTGTSVKASAELYARLAQSLKGSSVTGAQMITITDTLNKAFRVSGASAQEAENALIQLSQGLAAGALRGEEFNSISEQGARIMDLLADELNVTRGELRAMAADGQLTTEVLTRAILNQSSKINQEYSTLGDTVGQAIQRIQNNLFSMVGTSKDASEAQQNLVNVFNDLADFLASDEAKNGFAAIVGGINSVVAAAVEGISWITTLNAAIKDLTSSGEGADDGVGLGSSVFDIGSAINRSLGIPEFRIGGQDQPFGNRSSQFSAPIFDVEDFGTSPSMSPRGRAPMSAASRASRAADDRIRDMVPDEKPAMSEENLKALDQANEKARLAREAAQESIDQLATALEQEAAMVGMTNEEREVQVALLEAERISREGGLGPLSATAEARIRSALATKQEKEAQEELEAALERGQEKTDAILASYQTRIDTLGMTTDEQIRYNAEQQIANLLQDENTKITESQIEAIRRKAGALADATKAQEAADEAAQKAKDAQAEAARQAEELGNVFATAFEDAIVNGEDLGDTLKALEQDILRILTRILITKPLQDTIGGIVSGDGSENGGIFGPLGGLFGGLFGGKSSTPSIGGVGGGAAAANAGGGGGLFGMLFSGLGSLFGSFFESGGTVGQGGRARKAMNPAAFAGAPSAAVGGMLPDSGAIPIMAHRGERILNRAETNDYNRGIGRGRGRGYGDGSVQQVFNIQTTGDRIRDAENAQQTAIRAREQMQRTGRNF